MSKNNIIEWVKTIVISVIIALIITMFIRPTLVLEYSMYPTIKQYDYLIINKITYKINQPRHGDIVVFKSELLTEGGKKKQLIKRIIGIPGDTMEIKDGVVYRNGEPLKEDFINGDFTPGEMTSVTVPEGEYFLMGDNRPNSLDSRSQQVGMVSKDRIIGKAFLRLFPFNKIGFLH